MIRRYTIHHDVCVNNINQCDLFAPCWHLDACFSPYIRQRTGSRIAGHGQDLEIYFPAALRHGHCSLHIVIHHTLIATNLHFRSCPETEVVVRELERLVCESTLGTPLRQIWKTSNFKHKGQKPCTLTILLCSSH